MSTYFKISKNKTLEFQVEGKNYANDIFNISLRWSRKEDHAGLRFEFTVYKLFFISLSICDNRHFNYDEDRWCEYNEKIS